MFHKYKFFQNPSRKAMSQLKVLVLRFFSYNGRFRLNSTVPEGLK